MKLIKKYKFTIIGAFLGAGFGYAYYYFIGCANGSCAITSNPVNSSFYGVLLGGLIGSSVSDIIENKKTNKI